MKKRLHLKVLADILNDLKASGVFFSESKQCTLKQN